MKLLENIYNIFYDKYHNYKQLKRWQKLKSLGMKIGKGVNLPSSTWIDIPHCFLISIGDNCGFGPQCLILAHDAMPNEYLDATCIGKVIIHESCHFGARTVILPGVEIGPNSIVGANSVVTKSIPPNSVASGNPAKVIMSLEEYLNKHRKKLKTHPNFEYKEYSIQYLTEAKLTMMLDLLSKNEGYMVGGYTAMNEEGECLFRTE